MLSTHAFSESHLLYKSTCLKFAKEEIKPNAKKWEENEAFPRELFQKAGAVGLLGPDISEDFGGGGGDALHSLLMLESLMQGESTGVVAGLGSLSIALPPIMELATPEQKKRIIPPLLKGDDIAALAVTEPSVGSDVANIKLSAKKTKDGYLLSGQKAFITSGCHANILITLARTSDIGASGLTFFKVNKEQGNLHVGKKMKKTGWCASDTAELIYDNVFVPEEDRLGTEGTGFKVLMRSFAKERLALAFMGHASAEIAFNDAFEYVKDRQAFGKPIASFQVTRHKLAEMATKIAVAKNYNHYLALELSQGRSHDAEIAMAKNFSAQIAQDVCYQAVQLLGGAGFLRETNIERLSRDVRLLSIGGGTSEIMNEIIANHIYK